MQKNNLLNHDLNKETDRVMRQNLYSIGSIAAWTAILLGVIEIVITFLPGGNTVQETVVDWFELLQQNAFMGLRDLGLINIFFTLTAVPVFLALLATHQRSGFAWIALIFAFTGTAVFLATNRAFAMLALSDLYALGDSQLDQGTIIAAGQALLSVGQSHTAGTFPAFFLNELAGIIISLVMLRERIFSKLNALAGIAGFTFLLIFEISSSFFTELTSTAMFFAMTGGLLSMVWYGMLGLRMNRLAH